MIDLTYSNSGMDNGSPKCEVEKRIQSSPGNPAKRLKQACLQFKSVSGVINHTPAKTSRKRPLSSTEEDLKNTIRGETEDAGSSSRIGKPLANSKENKGPLGLQNKHESQKKFKCNKKQHTELKSNISSTTKDGERPNVIVDLESDTNNDCQDIEIINIKECDHGTCPVDNVEPSQLNADVGNNSGHKAKIKKTTSQQSTNDNVTKSESQELEPKCSHVEANELLGKTDINDASSAATSEHRNEKCKEHAKKSTEAVVFGSAITKRNSTKCSIDDVEEHVKNCIEAVVLGSLNVKDMCLSSNAKSAQCSELTLTPTSKIPLAELDAHIDACIDTVVANSSLNEELSNTDVNALQKRPKEPVRKKKLTKVRSPSDSLAKELETQEKLKVQLEIARLRAELKKLGDEAKEQRGKEKAEAIAKRKKEEMEKAERMQLKEEEKKQKQEALQAKMEEKIKKAKEKQEKEEEKKKAEEEEARKKNKLKETFVSFFVKKKDTNQQTAELELSTSFGTATDNAQRAPLHRNCLSNSIELVNALDLALQTQTCSVLYLEQLRTKQFVPGKCLKLQLPVEVDLEITQCNGEVEHPKKSHRAKLLQFSEDVRPPYWGTWRKRSKILSARNPFIKDDKLLDYDVDSEAEWEEEESGESLSHSEGEKESEDDYEVDNEFFVPHGYLSNEENQDEDGEVMSPADLKAQLKVKQNEFEMERKSKCQQLKPSVLGCFWIGQYQPGNEELIKVLDEFSAVNLTPGPISTRYSLWLTATAALPSTPPSDIVDVSPSSSQINFDKPIIHKTLFSNKIENKPLVCKNSGGSPVIIDLSEDSLPSELPKANNE